MKDRVDVRDLSNDALADRCADWNDLMSHAFNGTPIPKEHPRSELNGSPWLDGKPLAFHEFQLYCKGRGII